MYQLFFCEDADGKYDSMRDLVKSFCEQESIDISKTYVCKKKDYLMNLFEQDEDDDRKIVFLDIDIDWSEEGGVGVAKEIQQKDSQAAVVFLSSKEEYNSRIYSARHCFYSPAQKLASHLPLLFEEIIPAYFANTYQWLNLKRGNSCLRIPQKDIIYLERNMRKSYIITRNGEIYETKEKLDDLCRQLDPHIFLRCHNSYVVCKNEIKEVSYQSAHLFNGQSLNISRSRFKMIKKKLRY